MMPHAAPLARSTAPRPIPLPPLATPTGTPPRVRARGVLPHLIGGAL